MDICLLRVIQLLASRGYYVRGEEDKNIVHSLEERGLVEKKQKTRNIYVITDFGLAHLENTFNGKEISTEEFYKVVSNSYRIRASSMRPFVKIRDLKQEIMEQEKISEKKVEDFLLKLHQEGRITLQSGLQSEIGTISNPTGGNYAYVMVEGVI